MNIRYDVYGGHYGPAFAHYFLQQNEAIANGSISSITLNLKTLGVGNGLTDSLNQYPQYMEYAASNPYRPTVSTSVIQKANNPFYAAGGCQSLVSLIPFPSFFYASMDVNNNKTLRRHVLPSSYLL